MAPQLTELKTRSDRQSIGIRAVLTFPNLILTMDVLIPESAEMNGSNAEAEEKNLSKYFNDIFNNSSTSTIKSPFQRMNFPVYVVETPFDIDDAETGSDRDGEVESIAGTSRMEIPPL